MAETHVFKVERCPRCKYKHHEPNPKVNKPCPRCATPMKYSANWYYSITVDGVKHVRAGSPNKSYTEDCRSKDKVDVREGKFDMAVKTPWPDAVREFRKKGMIGLDPDTVDMYENSLQALEPHFKNCTLDQISVNMFDDFAADRQTEKPMEGKTWQEIKKERLRAVSTTTINRELATLKRLLNLSIEWDLLIPNKNTLKVLKRKKYKETERVRVLTQAQIKALLFWCKAPHLRLAVLIALNTGLRKEGVLEIRRGLPDIDMKNGTISRVVKGNKRVRIPMTDPLRRELTTYLSSLNIASPFLFPSKNGKRVLSTSKPLRSDANIGFKTALKRAGIEDFRFHDLRHTFATWFLQKTGDLEALREILGHSTIEQTRKYVKYLDAHKRRAMRKFEGVC